jgi:hypothetical protein
LAQVVAEEELARNTHQPLAPAVLMQRRIARQGLSVVIFPALHSVADSLLCLNPTQGRSFCGEWDLGVCLADRR